jgi:dimethylargininase
VIAITRAVSPSINSCELTFHARQPIDVAKASAQHKEYENVLAELGCEIVSLPAEADLPDAVFVEDAAVVVDEVAIIPIMGASSRRPETQTLAKTLSRYRPLEFLKEPATLDGGDVLRIDRSLFVGLSTRTNQQAITQLRDILRPYDYEVHAVEVGDCLHLKTACSFIGRNTVLINQSFIDIAPFRQFDFVDVAAEEQSGADVIFLNDTVISPASFPKTHALLEQRGFRVRSIDSSELQKAEAGVTCSSIIFER